MTTTRTCPECGQGVPAKKGPGRPAVYCSSACRKKAHQIRQVAQLRGEPIRIIRESAPKPVTKTVLRTRTVYKKPTRPELSALLRDDPVFLSEVLEDLRAFLGHRNVPVSTQKMLASRLGEVIIRLYRAQSGLTVHSDLPENSTGLAPGDWATAATETGTVEELVAAVQAHRTRLVQQEESEKQFARYRKDREQERIEAKHREADRRLDEVRRKAARLEATYEQARVKGEAADHAYQVWQKHGNELKEKVEQQQQELQKTRRLNEILEQRVATTKPTKTSPGASFYRQ